MQLYMPRFHYLSDWDKGIKGQCDCPDQSDFLTVGKGESIAVNDIGDLNTRRQSCIKKQEKHNREYSHGISPINELI